MRYSTLSNQEIYREKLLKEFHIEPPHGELFLPIAKSYGHKEDEERVTKQRSTFYGKKWNEVFFDDAYEFGWEGTPAPTLSRLGEAYYLPAFLSYFYEVKNLEKENLRDYFHCIVFSMSEGKEVLDEFTIGQAKLIALCLVNLANLLDDTNGDDWGYQKAVTSDWGYFLLF